MTDVQFECRLDVFDDAEKRRYAALRAAMKAAARITLERRCCPFSRSAWSGW
ncbi:MAG: hypothetical protein ACREJ9_00605 [Candidatus Rokuibacteriota bacterium]